MRFEEASPMVQTHECAQCGMPLVVLKDQGTDDYYLACGADKGHQGYKERESVGVAVSRGKGDKALGRGAQADMERSLSKAKHPLSLMSQKDLGTNDALTPERIAGLVAWGESLGLKPYLGHVCLYYGSPYVTIDGYYYRLVWLSGAMKTGTRPLAAQERLDYQIPEGAHAWIAEAWVGNVKLPTTGLGIVTLDMINEKSKKHPDQFRGPIAHDHPQRMAEKRAEWQLLRKLVPLDEAPANGG